MINDSEFEKDALESIKHFPTLSFKKNESIGFLKGDIPVIDESGKYWHSYEVEIYNSRGYPYMFPIVFETGGAIKRIADWHINIDGSCCLDNEFSQQIKCFNKLTILQFLQTELIPWLANQSFRRIEGYYPNGEQSHGDIGRIEFFMEKLKAPNFSTCIDWMILIAKRELPGRTAKCFCGSGKKYRHCHKSDIDNLLKIHQESLIFMIRKFIDYLKGGVDVASYLQKNSS